MNDRLGNCMTDAAGRAKLAKQLREEAERFKWASAVMIDAAKVLESDVQRMTPPLVWPELPTT